MKSKSKFFKYFREYEWSNVFAMIRNNRKDPLCHLEDIPGKNVLITGATSGIGYLTARKFASHGANLKFINRKPGKTKTPKHETERECKVKCHCIIADLSLISDIKKASHRLENYPDSIDVIIHNAGVYLTKKEITTEGIEKTFAVHYLSSFIINYLLAEKLKAQAKARIIMVGSEGHRFAAWGLKVSDLNFEKQRYSGLKAYGSAKLAQLLSMIKFREYYSESGVSINTMHPGAVKTDTGQENGAVYKWFNKNFLDKNLRRADISAEAIYYLAAAPELEGISGEFFNLTTPEEPSPPALDSEVADELWEVSLGMSGLKCA